MKPSFFSEKSCIVMADKIKTVINNEPDFLSLHTASSPRAVGDAIQSLVGKRFLDVSGDMVTEYSDAFARRAMADMAFRDKEGFYNIVDVKTHRQDTSFNMPALVSVERLSRFYEDDMNIFSILMVKYHVDSNHLTADEVIFCPIEFLEWEYLTIGALGWGQIQISNSNKMGVDYGCSRKKWMLLLCDMMDAFYPKEIAKIAGRRARFNEIRLFWESKQE